MSIYLSEVDVENVVDAFGQYIIDAESSEGYHLLEYDNNLDNLDGKIFEKALDKAYQKWIKDIEDIVNYIKKYNMIDFDDINYIEDYLDKSLMEKIMGG